MLKQSLRRLYFKRNILKKCPFNSCYNHLRISDALPLTTYRTSHNLSTFPFQIRNFNLSTQKFARTFKDTENVHCYNILKGHNIINKEAFLIKSANENISSLQEFNSLLDKNYRTSTIEEIIRVFNDARKYCIENQITLSDTRFDKLVDGLMDNCEYLSDDMLYDLLKCLLEYPPCQSYDARNYHDVWSCLDDMCCWRMHDWNLDRTFMYAELWYKLNLGKLSDFMWEINDKALRKCNHLTKNQVILTFFYLNVCRKKYVDFNLEDVAAQYIKEMTIDEMAVIALGFFKSHSKVKMMQILEEMMKKVIAESETVNDISLAAILKVVRLSIPTKLIDLMYQMLDRLVPEIDRLSYLSCLHIAIIGTGMQAMHKASMIKATEKIAGAIETVRVKEIERMLMALTMFEIDPKDCHDFYEKAYRELHNNSRAKELAEYNRIVPCSLQFLAIRGIYSYELMNKVLDVDFINEVYGKPAKMLSKDVFTLDVCIDIECPDYKGNRIPKERRYKAAKWLTEFVPSHDQYTKHTAADKFFLETLDTLKQIVKDDKFILTDHVIPCFSKGDIILCKDMNTNKFIEPFGFEKYILGDVMIPSKKDNIKWYALVVVGWNNTLRGTTIPSGYIKMKQRLLKTIGYEPVFVVWNEFMLLPKEAKLQYLTYKLL